MKHLDALSDRARRDLLTFLNASVRDPEDRRGLSEEEYLIEVLALSQTGPGLNPS